MRGEVRAGRREGVGHADIERRAYDPGRGAGRKAGGRGARVEPPAAHAVLPRVRPICGVITRERACSA